MITPVGTLDIFVDQALERLAGNKWPGSLTSASVCTSVTSVDRAIAYVENSNFRRSREGGNPVACVEKSLGPRLRGNDEDSGRFPAFR